MEFIVKGKQWEGKDHHPNHLFAHMHQNTIFQLQNHHHFQTSLEHTTTTDENPPPPPPTAAADSDGATIELLRRPRGRRGRPPGSKNKPKPALIVTQVRPDPFPAMHPYILEVPTGLDLIHSITQFSNKRNTAICVLSAAGAVSGATLRHPSTGAGAAVTFRGCFDLLSLSATVFPSSSSLRGNNNNCHDHEFCISLGGPGGQVVGGKVVGPLYAAATVYVVAASFNSPSFHRLPVEEDNEGLSSGHGGGDGGSAAAGESCGVASFYGGGHMGSW